MRVEVGSDVRQGVWSVGTELRIISPPTGDKVLMGKFMQLTKIVKSTHNKFESLNVCMG